MSYLILNVVGDWSFLLYSMQFWDSAFIFTVTGECTPVKMVKGSEEREH